MAISVFSGCSTTFKPTTGDGLDMLDWHLERNDYVGAFLSWKEAAPILRTIDEGAIGQRFSMMIDRTAATGQKTWVEILMHPGISDDLKIALTEEIHLNAIRGIYSE